jgi:hypothetical protein
VPSPEDNVRSLEINGRRAQVPAGGTVLDACRSLGVPIPTMCYLDGYEYFTSCMVCVVKEKKSGRLLPSCSALAQDGMAIETDSEEVRDARRTALELLLSDHVGDCEGPCQRACPAHMDIPLMIRQIRENRMRDAIRTVRRDIVLPAVLGRICPAPCEKVCRRAQADEAVSICLLKRHAADTDHMAGSPWDSPPEADKGKKVAVVGAGPAGLAAAAHLRRDGYAVALYDDHDAPGGTLRTSVPEERLPRRVVDLEADIIRRSGVEFRMGVRVGQQVGWTELKKEFQAVVLAVGSKDAGKLKEMFGVETTRRGVKVDSGTFQTSDPMVFAAGGAVAECKMAVRALAQGKAAACSVDQFLSGRPVTGPRDRFNSVIGRLQEGEIEEFRKSASSDPRVVPSGGVEAGFAHPEAEKECGRCFHCDCRKPESCRLRRYAEEYGAEQSKLKGTSRCKFAQVRQHADIVYEPEKCIKCGLCVRITEKAREPLGLAFVGRGFTVRIRVPFHESLQKGLEKTGAECVKACPTGALSFLHAPDEGFSMDGGLVRS